MPGHRQERPHSSEEYPEAPSRGRRRQDSITEITLDLVTTLALNYPCLSSSALASLIFTVLNSQSPRSSFILASLMIIRILEWMAFSVFFKSRKFIIARILFTLFNKSLGFGIFLSHCKTCLVP
jgi:hypothetical protein